MLFDERQNDLGHIHGLIINQHNIKCIHVFFQIMFDLQVKSSTITYKSAYEIANKTTYMIKQKTDFHDMRRSWHTISHACITQ